MVTSVDEIPKLLLEVSTTGFATNLQVMPADDLTTYTIDFLRKQGINASPGSPKGTGATAGVPEIFKGVSWLVKVWALTAKYLAKRAHKLVRADLPLANVRFDSSVEAERERWNLPTAFQTSEILALLPEVSGALQRDFPLLNFEFTISAAKNDDTWVHVTLGEDLVSYPMIHRLRRKVLAKRTAEWTLIKVRAPWWWPWGLILAERRAIDESQWDCRNPLPQSRRPH